jgi:hypothetical protein
VFPLFNETALRDRRANSDAKRRLESIDAESKTARRPQCT